MASKNKTIDYRNAHLPVQLSHEYDFGKKKSTLETEIQQYRMSEDYKLLAIKNKIK